MKKAPMTFAEFMQLALYHHEYGYYANHIPGSAGQYHTSPSLSPWFGRLLMRLFDQMDEELQSNGPFTVVEVGAGSGHLAQAALSDLMEGRLTETSRKAIQWIIVERFELVKGQQQDLLTEFPNIEWVSSLGDIEAVEGCLVVNEVIDNSPVNVLEVTEDGVKEVFVTSDGQGFTEELGPLSDKRLEEHARRAQPNLEDGDRFEVMLGIDQFIAEISAVIERGYFLAFDYGDEEPLLWKHRPAGSMVSYFEGTLDVDVLSDPGKRDITSHVNFSHLARALTKEEWNPDALQTQRELLLKLGAAKEAESLRKLESQASGADALRLISERSALTTLYREGALGDIRVLTARKGS